MLEQLRAWPGPAEPYATEALAHEQGLEVLASARAHVPTQRLRSGLPIALTLLAPLPILLGSLPLFLLLSFPVLWLFLPWSLRAEWLANQATFCADTILQRGIRDPAPKALPLAGLNRIEATMDPLQARSGSCTLRFLHAQEGDEEGAAVELARVRDVEAGLAHRLMQDYAKRMQAPGLEA